MLFIDIVFCISICYNGCVARSEGSGPYVSTAMNQLCHSGPKRRGIRVEIKCTWVERSKWYDSGS